jgi:FkbM family methyltransferase
MITTLKARLNSRLDLQVNLDDWMTPTIHHALASDRYERIERDMVEAGCRPWDKVVEIGAGLGVISAMCARICGNDSVVAYEANPRMIGKIEETYRLNDVRPNLHNVILGEKDGEQELYIHPDFWESSTIISQSKVWRPEATVKVPVWAAHDALCNVTMLICDIEGGEAELFKSLGLPESIKKIVVETHPHVIGKKATDRLMADFYSAGFTLISETGDVWFLARA